MLRDAQQRMADAAVSDADAQAKAFDEANAVVDQHIADGEHCDACQLHEADGFCPVWDRQITERVWCFAFEQP